MKSKIRKMLDRIVALILIILIWGCVPLNVLAETISSDNEFDVDSTLSSIEDAASLGAGSYTYTPPSEGSFVIANVTGCATIVDGSTVIQFDDFTVSVPDFDYYRIVDVTGNLRFYQADVLKNPEQMANFAYVGIYVDSASDYSLHVQYAVDSEQRLYNITIPLTEEQFLHFTSNASEMCIGTDAVSQRLKSSGRVYTHGTVENYDYSSALSGSGTVENGLASTYALNTIAANTYDSYTNSDGIIKNYESDYFGECYLDDGDTITDDPIVEIIPKELCFIPGEHIYVGKEYGFFIRVVVDTLDYHDFAVDVMVFDIIHFTPSFTTSETGYSKVVPLFQYKYRAADTDSFGTDVDPSLTRVVFPHFQYDYVEYFLKDVGFKFTIDNPTALNPDDAGYDPYSDEGAFMIQTRANARGVGLKQKNGSFSADTAMFTLGFVPYLGTGLSILSYAHDLYDGFGNGNYFCTRTAEVSNNEININTLKTNSTDQIEAYGNLIKSQSVKFVSDTEKPRLIHVGGGYVEAKYLIARKSGSLYNKIRVTTSISVSVVEDNTSVFLGIESGELINYGRGTGTYETGNYTRLSNIALNGASTATILANSQTHIIKIVPRVSGTYKLFTSTNVGDPNFRITNATTGAATVYATDDINGSSNRNATLTLSLIKGNIYYIEAFRYGTPYVYTLRIGYNPVAAQIMALDEPCSFNLSGNSYQMLKFTPAASGYYEFSTNRTSGDPQIFLFATSGILLASDDDSGESLDAYLRYYLIAGNTYYIAVQGYGGNAAAFNITVSQG